MGILLTLVFTLLSNSYATYLGSHDFQINACIFNLNMAVSEQNMAPTLPIWIDHSGKLQVNREQLTSYEEKENVTTITYKVPNYVNSNEVIKTVAVTKENGKITKISHISDTGFLKEMSEEERNKQEYVARRELNYLHENNTCHLTSSELITMKNGKESSVTTYDKSFCDQIQPFIKAMAKAEINRCTSLFAKTTEAFKMRKSELAKANKTFDILVPSEMMQTPPEENSLAYALSLINSCNNVESPIHPGMGMGAPWGQLSLLNGGIGGTGSPANGIGGTGQAATPL